MSIILASLILAGTSGAVALGRLLLKRRAEAGAKPPALGEGDADDAKNDRDDAGADAAAREDGTDEARDERGGKAKASKTTAPKDAKSRPALPPAPKLDGFVCQLGDVVMRITGEEAWLAGGLVLSEELPVAVLFVAPEAGRDRALYVTPKPRDTLFWLDPLDPSAILVGGEPPSSVEHGGIRFDRVRRLPLRPQRIGLDAPDVGDAVIVAEYASAGAERLVVLKATTGTVRAYRGQELEPSSYEVIASGKATLE